MFFQPLFRFFFCFHVRKQTKYKSLSFTHAAFPRNVPVFSLQGIIYEKEAELIPPQDPQGLKCVEGRRC